MHRIAALFLVILLVLSGGGNFADPAPVTPAPLLPIPGTPQAPDPLGGFRGLQPTPAAVTPAAPNTSRFEITPQAEPTSQQARVWDTLLADDFTATTLPIPWTSDVSPFVVAEADNDLLRLNQPDLVLPLREVFTAETELSIDMRLIAGSVALGLHNTAAGSYRAIFSSDGTLALIRGEVILASSSFQTYAPDLSSYVLRLEGGELGVFVDEALVASVVDPAPLPPGPAFVATGTGVVDARLDNVVLTGVLESGPETRSSGTTGLNCEDTGYDWCAPLDFRLGFYGFSGGPRTEGIGYHGPATATAWGYHRWYRGEGQRYWGLGSYYNVRKIVVLYDYAPGQVSGCPANYIDIKGASSSAWRVVRFDLDALPAGTDQVISWSGSKNLYDRMHFSYQHACRHRIPAIAPSPAGSMTIKKIVVYGYGSSPFGPISTPTPTSTPDCGSGIRAASPVCLPVSNGLHAVYFDGFQVLDDVLERPLSFDPAVDFADAADWALASDVYQFSARWTGRFVPGADITPPPAVQDLTLTFSGLDFQTDGLRVWWDGQPIINTWGDNQTGAQFGTAVSATIPAVSAGQPYPLWIEYHHYDRTETTVPQLSLSYSYDGASGAVPTAWLSPSDPEGVIPYADPYIIASPAVPAVRTLDQLAACVDGKTGIVPVFPGATVEHTDLLAVADEADGLIVHDGPTWNSPLALHRGWGTAADLDGVYIEFPRTGFTSEVWYRQPGDQWINLRSEDLYYVIGASDTVANPCDLPQIAATDTITFTYDRERAARYAIEHSYANNLSSPGAYRVTRRLHPDLPFANFTYADLAGGTGSAMFTSESIWSGHLPMTIGDPNSCNLSLGASEVGWRVCTSSSGPNLNSSPAWDTHEGVLSYYTDGRPVGVQGFSVNSILDSQHGQIMWFELSDRLRRENLNDFLDFRSTGPNRDITIIDANGLANFSRTYLGPHDSLDGLSQGDYIFVDTSPTHGLLVLGWGPIVSCQESISIVHSMSDFETEASLNTDLIPYVADSTGVQQPIPRPFYCTAWDQSLDPSLDFTPHNWFFFTLPSIVQLSSQDLNILQAWHWETADEQ